MRQLALDIGLPVGPTFDNYLCGGNGQAVQHLEGIARGQGPSGAPVYLWGAQGVGKSHLLKATVAGLRERGAKTGWLDASVALPSAFDES